MTMCLKFNCWSYVRHLSSTLTFRGIVGPLPAFQGSFMVIPELHWKQGLGPGVLLFRHLYVKNRTHKKCFLNNLHPFSSFACLTFKIFTSVPSHVFSTYPMKAMMFSMLRRKSVCWLTFMFSNFGRITSSYTLRHEFKYVSYILEKVSKKQIILCLWTIWGEGATAPSGPQRLAHTRGSRYSGWRRWRHCCWSSDTSGDVYPGLLGEPFSNDNYTFFAVKRHYIMQSYYITALA